MPSSAPQAERAQPAPAKAARPAPRTKARPAPVSAAIPVVPAAAPDDAKKADEAHQDTTGDGGDKAADATAGDAAAAQH
ncbi:hypothetical protein [Cellulomonas sp.]|uniref:hypothetical protein n=1 Tax=Cellulomonas sp. TaxID=40001 RepID=UPI001B1068A1|nr:hypothetical protein [Cellulomonas sp.]MBO9556515.1 hypothetical protein [Cellulomonas sp.]